MNQILTKLQNENEVQYLWRIGNAKSSGEINMSWEELTPILNKQCGFHDGDWRGESSWRKKYRAYLEAYENVFSKTNNDGIYIDNRILCISDCHVPYQLPITLLEKYKGKVDTLVLNGDIGDCQAISRFPKIYRKSPMEEIIETRQYIISMIEYLNPKKVVVIFGNHDLRFQSYMAKNLDTDLLELMPETSLELICVDGFKYYNKRDKTKIEYKPLIEVFKDIEINYVGSWFYQLGDIIFAHPKSFSSGILKTAEKAMYFFRNEGYNFKNLVLAHTHRLGQYIIGDTIIYEQGAFCDVKLNNYSDGTLVNSQKEGFIYICQDINKNTIKDKTELIVLN